MLDQVAVVAHVDSGRHEVLSLADLRFAPGYIYFHSTPYCCHCYRSETKSKDSPPYIYPGRATEGAPGLTNEKQMNNAVTDQSDGKKWGSNGGCDDAEISAERAHHIDGEVYILAKMEDSRGSQPDGPPARPFARAKEQG
jgi:hypothetical protein